MRPLFQTLGQTLGRTLGQTLGRTLGQTLGCTLGQTLGRTLGRLHACQSARANASANASARASANANTNASVADRFASRAARLLALALLPLAAFSCVHPEICYDNTRVTTLRVAYDWSEAPEADANSFDMFLFPSDGGRYLHYELVGRQGSTLRVPTGKYRAICVNSNTENITYKNRDRFSTFEVTTRPGDILSDLSALAMSVRSSRAPRAAGTELEEVLLSPDLVWTAAVDEFELSYANGETTITFRPRQAWSDYSVEIRGAKNLRYILGTSATLSSLSEGWMPSTGTPAEECATIPFNTLFNPAEERVTGTFRTFGPGPEPKKHILTVYAILADERSWYYTFDVTDQVLGAENPRDVHIILDGLPIPKPIVNGGGFHPEVREWEGVVVPIVL